MIIAIAVLSLVGAVLAYDVHLDRVAWMVQDEL